MIYLFEYIHRIVYIFERNHIILLNFLDHLIRMIKQFYVNPNLSSYFKYKKLLSFLLVLEIELEEIALVESIKDLLNKKARN